MVTFPTAQAALGHVVSALRVNAQPGMWGFSAQLLYSICKDGCPAGRGDRREKEVGAFLDSRELGCPPVA